jgi:putative tricarboxylic transport membrane protein
MNGRAVAGEALIAIALIALGAFIILDATTIRVAVTYARIGPRVIPYGVGAGLLVLGVLLLAGARARLAARPADEDRRWDAAALLRVAAGLAAQLALIKPLGFVISSAILFTFAASAFGSRRPWLDLPIGLVLAALTFLGFTRGLGLTLPAGPLAGIL